MKKKTSTYGQQFDDSFYSLAKDITKILQERGDVELDPDHLNSLMEQEEVFRKDICRYAQAFDIYTKFIITVVVQNKHILSARPYFRERSAVFRSSISPAIKQGDVKKLQTFHINYNLIKFIKDNWKGPFPTRADKAYKKMLEKRNRLLENNLPLAINRAKLFYRKTNEDHLSLLDLINICVTGLASGIDKWTGPHSRVFKGVCIGRMVGNMIDLYSDTLVHFYPSDKKILYRARALRQRLQIDDITKLAEAVNESFKNDKEKGMSAPEELVSVAELTRLLGAAESLYSSDYVVSNDNGDTPVFFHETMQIDQENEESAEDRAVRRDLLGKMNDAMQELSLIEKKILRLKGVSI